jgi:ssDNA-binding Zn-finger/Zn-ribbon topoisomerase 1
MKIGNNNTKRNETCKGCGGTGQISFFKGVSRFLISCEECPECSGLGYTSKSEGGAEEPIKLSTTKRSK